ncbi:PAS-domain containing protein [Massilia sp. W12]|uniref:PAS-domain containing protein n=1 Tax=Massilia sp. W12 TaxID=3126507 RepID=UPI0030CFE954
MSSDARLAPDAMLRTMLDLSEEAMLVMQGGRILACNVAAVNLLQMAQQDLCGMSLVRLLAACPEQVGAACSALLERLALPPQEREVIEGWLQPGKSAPFLAEIIKKPWPQDEKGWYVLLLRNVSAQRRVEQALQDKTVVLQSLLDNFPGGVSLIDKDLRFVVWNRGLLDMFEFSEEQFQPDNPPSLPDLYRFNIARGEYGEVSDPEALLEQMIERARRFEAHLFERTRNNGAVLEIRGAPIVHGDKGGFVTTYLDVSARHVMAEKLRRQSVLLQAVLENLPQGICVFDEKLRVELWNSTLAHMLGLPQESFVRGVEFETLLRLMAARGDGESPETEREIMARMNQIRSFREHRYERTSKSGSTHLVQGKPVSIDGKLAVFITTLTDITDRKQAELAQCESNAQLARLVKELQETRADLVRSEKLAALGALVAGVAHELNTPLGNSLLMASALQDATGMIRGRLEAGGVARTDLSVYLEEAADASALILRNLGTAAELIIRFKQIAIDQAGAERGVFKLAALAQDTIDLLQEKIDQCGHEVVIDIDGAIEMDSFPGPLEQVIANLVNNSLLHAYEGRRGGHMRLSARLLPARAARGPGAALEKPSPRVLLEFHDDGCGIAPDIQNRIFDPFFTTKVGRGGTGLGLSISYNIITSLLGGQVSVHSSSGRGASFLLDLPLIAPPQAD